MNVAQTLAARAAATPGMIAVREPLAGPPATRPYREMSYDALAREAEIYASAVRALGFRPGERIAIMIPPSIAFFAVIFGLFHAGVVPVCIDPGMGMKSLKRCLDEADPHAFIGVRKAQIARVLFGWRKGRRALTPERLRAQGAGRAACYEPSDEEIAAILFTSGSTGAPKGAVYRHAHFLAQIELLRSTYAIQPGETDLCTFPLFGLFAPALGMSAVIPKMDFTRPATIDPSEVIIPAQRFGISNLFGSPALLRRLAAAPGRLPSLKRVISAGAPVPVKVLTALAPKLSPEAEIHTPYGATEALPVATIGHKEILAQTAAATAEGRGICVGRPVAGAEVRVIAIDDAPIAAWRDARELPRGAIGELVVAGPQTTERYYQRPEAECLAKIEGDGGRVWHRMGDLGYVDDSGRLWFCGRKSHRVATVRGDLYTIPCEGVFNCHAEVHRSALIGRGNFGQMRPVLCVELERRGTGRDHLRIAAELLRLGRRSSLTRDIAEIRFFRALPVDTRHNAKIFREKLKVMVESRWR